jgi:DNA polymerase-3 subunit alpha
MDVVIAGLISSRRNKITKNNDTMAFIELEDLYGKIEVIVFPRNLVPFNSILQEDNIVFIKGKLQLKEDELPKVICQTVKEIKLTQKLYLKFVNEADNRLEEIREILKKDRGVNVE